MKISEKFREGKEQKRSLLIGFITAGDPSIELTPKLAKALVDGGVDIIELGKQTNKPVIIFGSHYIAKPIFDKFGFYN